MNELRRYAERWDGLGETNRCASPKLTFTRHGSGTPPELPESAVTQAAENNGDSASGRSPKFAARNSPGISLGQLVRPLDSVGCYVPGGRYPLPSTLLMTVIPAQVAGVPQIRVVSPRPARARSWRLPDFSAYASSTALAGRTQLRPLPMVRRGSRA